MEQPVPAFGYETEVEIQHILARPAFDELVNLAAETCLTAPRRMELHEQALKTAERPPTADAELVAKLGLWGVRSAHEMHHYPDSFTGRGGSRDPLQEDILLGDSSIMHPSRFSGRIDRDVQRKIEAFGQAVLDEAFICLGEDALDKVREYQSARGAKQKLHIINWLTKRVDQIQRHTDPRTEDVATEAVSPTGAGAEDEVAKEVYFYHPARLSPKLIGQFPDIEFNPTCLGVSVLVAAFAQKAGIPYLHAGVAQSSGEASREDYIHAIADVMVRAMDMGIKFPDAVRESFADIVRDAREELYKDHGYHAAVVMQITPTKWLQIDTNFNACRMYYKQESLELCEVYKTLTKLKPVAPSLEHMYDLYTGMEQPFVRMLYDRLHEQFAPTPEAIRSYLLEHDTATLAELAETFIDPLFSSEDNDATTQALRLELKRHTDGFIWKEKPDSAGRVPELHMQDVIRRYVFPDANNDDLTASLARCKRDPAYLERRVEDLLLAPLLYIVMLTGDLSNEAINGSGRYSHATLELGLPAYRIGAAILSDFDIYCGGDIPASFWLTYWPSHVSVTERIGQHENRPDEYIQRNTATLLAKTRLRYSKSHSIIQKFLEELPD
ncbi:MAG: hypothetical protein JWN38_299 [Candidatus Saccharibacteria bacterium]|nr:hypothetical protein [Candidatus Saccharibacteria bacterium]